MVEKQNYKRILFFWSNAIEKFHSSSCFVYLIPTQGVDSTSASKAEVFSTPWPQRNKKHMDENSELRAKMDNFEKVMEDMIKKRIDARVKELS